VGAVITVLLAVCISLAQGNPQRSGRLSGEQQQPQTQQTPQTDQGQQQRRLPPPEENSSVTHHSARVGGQQTNYTATAATYVIKTDDGSPKATFFFVAYTKEDAAESSKHPLSFVYNGGPGSASLFTHMGLGSKRIVLTDDGHTVSHMNLEPPIRKNVSFTYYEAGHMMYIDKKAREKLHIRPLALSARSRAIVCCERCASALEADPIPGLSRSHPIVRARTVRDCKAWLSRE
jgi:carboxypeptidase C (cathepsin A)